MANWLDEFMERFLTFPPDADESHPTRESWTISTGPDPDVRYENVRHVELTVSPPPTESEEAFWRGVLLNLKDSVERLDILEHLTCFKIVGYNDDLSLPSKVKGRP